MFLRILAESFSRNPRRKVLTAVSLVLGMAVATATLSVALDVGDRLAREFRSLGANLLVTPQADTLPLEIGGLDYRPVDEGAYLAENDLGKLKTIFWRLNIVGFAPFLELPVELGINGRTAPLRVPLVGTWYSRGVPVPDGTTFTTGVSATHPWWRVEGRWFSDTAEETLVGATLARRSAIKTGDLLRIRSVAGEAHLTVTGIVSTGGPEDDAVVVPLAVAQRLANRPQQFRRLLVSALTKPEDDFARRDPDSMTPAEFDRWYCTPYISSISLQIKQELPGTEVHPIRRIAESEGHILTRVSGLMWLVTVAALLAATLAVGATSATTILDRRAEVGLMKALGATNWTVTTLFLSEQLLVALVGGAAGYLLGIGLGRVVGESVFGVAPEARLVLLPIVLALAVLVAVVGSIVPLGRAARFAPAPILRGE